VRVAARLVDARQGLELWSEQFDRELADTFAVQEEIAQAVVAAMRLRLSSHEQERLRQVGASRGTRDPRALELYLRARHAVMLHGDRRVLEARDAFQAALALDPGFAQALAGLADADVLFLAWNLDAKRSAELREEALRASEEALRLAPGLAEVRVAHANVLTLLGRWPEAEADFRRAVELNPGWGDACYFYARALFSEGRLDDAAAAFEEAARRNPDDFSSLALLEGVHKKRGDPAAARRAGLRGLEAVARRLALDPDDVRAHYLGAGLDLRYGDRDRAFLRIERALALLPDDFSTSYNAACFYAQAADRERALAALARAVEGGRGQRRWMERDPDLDALRGDPRFDALMARVST
jgi:adenylate cyclase